MKAVALPLLALGAAACQSVPPDEQAANPAQGFIIAQNSCAECHQVGRNGTSPDPDAPPFATIANRQGLTGEALSAWLREIHNYPTEMGFYLDDQQVGHLVAYMMRLRSSNLDRQSGPS